MKIKLHKKQLPFYAAFVQTAQYALAGWLFMGWLGLICVGLMGSLVSLTIAYAGSHVSDVAKARKLGSWLFMIALMSFSPILIGTATFLHLPQIDNLIWRGIVSAAWGFLPDGATALSGFIAGKGMIDNDNLPKVAGNKAGKKQGKKGNLPKVARKKMTNEDLLAYLAANPGATHGQVAEYFQVSRQAVGPRIKKLYATQDAK